MEDLISNEILSQLLKNIEQNLSDIKEEETKLPSKLNEQEHNKKVREIIPLLTLLKGLNIPVEKVKYTEEPDCILSIQHKKIGVEVVDNIDEKDKENLSHWNDLCDQLVSWLSIDSLPQKYIITLKDINAKGCNFKSFKADFVLYIKNQSNVNTKYIAQIKIRPDKRIVAYIDNEPRYNDIVPFIQEKKFDKALRYVQKQKLDAVWLIVNMTMSLSFDIELEPIGGIENSPYEKIFLIQYQKIRQIY